MFLSTTSTHLLSRTLWFCGLQSWWSDTSLGSSSSAWQSFQFHSFPIWVVFRLHVCILNPLIQITDEDIKESCPQYLVLGNTTCDWPPIRHNREFCDSSALSGPGHPNSFSFRFFGFFTQRRMHWSPTSAAYLNYFVMKESEWCRSPSSFLLLFKFFLFLFTNS